MSERVYVLRYTDRHPLGNHRRTRILGVYSAPEVAFRRAAVKHGAPLGAWTELRDSGRWVTGSIEDKYEVITYIVDGGGVA